MEVMVFDDADLAPREIPVRIGSEDFVLREADAFAASRFRNAAAAGMKMRDGKIVGHEGIGNLESLLLQLCLFKLRVREGETTREKVTEGFILKLPSRITRKLFEQAQDISELSEKGAADPDPELIGLCRRDMADLYHPDKGGGDEAAAVFKGVNIALDWLKKHKRPTAEELAKNAPSSTGSTSQ